MKRRFSTLILVMMTALLFAVSVSAADNGELEFVADTAGLLSAGERQALEQAAKEISDRYAFGVYLMTVDSFRDAADAGDVFDAATALYKHHDLGLGEERKGLLLLLSMRGRDFALITYSDYGNYVFDAETREEMTEWFLDDFARNDWYGGFDDYLSAADLMLSDGPGKLKSEILTMIGMIVLIPLLVAAVVVFLLGLRMKSIAMATRAEAYSGGLHLTRRYDRFTHATEIRRRRKQESGGGGGGGGTRSRSSGGFGGTTGKF